MKPTELPPPTCQAEVLHNAWIIIIITHTGMKLTHQAFAKRQDVRASISSTPPPLPEGSKYPLEFIHHVARATSNEHPGLFVGSIGRTIDCTHAEVIMKTETPSKRSALTGSNRTRSTFVVPRAQATVAKLPNNQDAKASCCRPTRTPTGSL